MPCSRDECDEKSETKRKSFSFNFLFLASFPIQRSVVCWTVCGNGNVATRKCKQSNKYPLPSVASRWLSRLTKSNMESNTQQAPADDIMEHNFYNSLPDETIRPSLAFIDFLRKNRRRVWTPNTLASSCQLHSLQNVQLVPNIKWWRRHTNDPITILIYLNENVMKMSSSVGFVGEAIFYSFETKNFQNKSLAKQKHSKTRARILFSRASVLQT